VTHELQFLLLSVSLQLDLVLLVTSEITHFSHLLLLLVIVVLSLFYF